MEKRPGQRLDPVAGLPVRSAEATAQALRPHGADPEVDHRSDAALLWAGCRALLERAEVYAGMPADELPVDARSRLHRARELVEEAVAVLWSESVK